MTISKLVVGLKNAELDLTATEIAELLWLWVQTAPSQESVPSQSPQNQEKTTPSTFESKTPLVQDRCLPASIPQSSKPKSVDLYPKVIDRYLVKEGENQNS